MFYKVKPIDMLLDDIFLVKICNWGEPLVSVPGEGVQLGEPVMSVCIEMPNRLRKVLTQGQKTKPKQKPSP